MTQALVTAALTVAVGALVFVLGQIALVLFIERIRLQARTIEEISEAIVHYGREYSVPLMKGEQLAPEKVERLRIAVDTLRRLAARLRASAVTLRYYRLLQALRLVLPRDSVIEASRSLMGLSNVLPPHDEHSIQAAIEFRKEVEQYLNIEIPNPQP